MTEALVDVGDRKYKHRFSLMIVVGQRRQTNKRAATTVRANDERLKGPVKAWFEALLSGCAPLLPSLDRLILSK
jgi:hypothetical protein